MVAIIKGNAKCVKILLGKNPIKYVHTKTGDNIMHLAVRLSDGAAEMVDIILKDTEHCFFYANKSGKKPQDYCTNAELLSILNETEAYQKV